MTYNEHDHMDQTPKAYDDDALYEEYSFGERLNDDLRDDDLDNGTLDDDLAADDATQDEAMSGQPGTTRQDSFGETIVAPAQPYSDNTTPDTTSAATNTSDQADNNQGDESLLDKTKDKIQEWTDNNKK